MAITVSQEVTETAPKITWAATKSYLGSRFTTLKPQALTPQEKKCLNPFYVLRQLNRKQWLFFTVAILGWVWDAFDYFSVSQTATEISKDLGVSVADITWGLSIVLMLRSVGAIIFGLASDRFGRKWPFIVNIGIFSVLELGTGFVQTYDQFLAVRALFGIAMGGMFGNAAATALEDCPPEARGLISGFLQAGYDIGNLFCVIFTRAIVPNSSHSWRALFWFGAGPPVLIMIFRAFLPETDTYIASRINKEDNAVAADDPEGLHMHTATKVGTWASIKIFLRGVGSTLKVHWLMFSYLVVMMAGFNFMAHGSQDLYPTLLKNQLKFSIDRSTVTNSVATLGALAGQVSIGHLSNVFGRRLSVIISCVVGGALIYPWAFSGGGAGINASVFFLQFFVGCWGIVPIHLSELTPPALRTSLVGVAYQLGNLASAASSTIEAKIGERFPIMDENGVHLEDEYDYGKVMAIFMGCVFAFTMIVMFLGPEKRGSDLSAPQYEVHDARGEDEHDKFDDKVQDKVEEVHLERLESRTSR